MSLAIVLASFLSGQRSITWPVDLPMSLPLELSDSFAAVGRMFGIRRVLWFLLDVAWFRNNRLRNGISQRLGFSDTETSIEQNLDSVPSVIYPIS